MKEKNQELDFLTDQIGDQAARRVSLHLKDRALDVAAEGITINDLRLPDQPLIYANQGFERLTLYPVKEIIGKNCRFLQGSATDQSVVDQLRTAIRERKECTVELLNYRKDGKPFWNRLSITPVKSESGETTHYIGVQSDITDRREAEMALLESREQLEAANQRMTSDLEAAARIQQSLLPQIRPDFKEAEFSWLIEPCEELAGDSLNVFGLDDEHIAFYTLDVSGHGVPAALLSVSLSHWLSPIPGQSSLFKPVPHRNSEFVLASPSEVAASLNKHFPMDMDNVQFFGITYGILNRCTGRLRYVSAGSPVPLLMLRNGHIQVLKGQGVPIGMVEDAIFEEQVIDLSPGARFFIYTDGIIEAENASGDEFQIELLMAALEESSSRSLDDCLESVFAKVKDWVGEDRLRDDATVLALEYGQRISP